MSQKPIVSNEEKLAIVLQHQKGLNIYALSRQTGYPAKEIRKWIDLYQKKGAAGFAAKKRVGFLLPVLLVIFAAALALSIVKLTQGNKALKYANMVYTNLAQSVASVHPQGEDDSGIDVSHASVTVDFAALQAINSQVVAWISNHDGSIHYPILHGTDNTYYLDHLPDGTVNENGAIFMDFRNYTDFSEKNTIVYGRNASNDAMFGSLRRYFKDDYHQQHPALLLVTPAGSYQLQVFAGCVAPGNSDIFQLTYADAADFGAYVDRIRAMSLFSSTVEIESGDRIVTLCACSDNHKDTCYVLFCKLVPM